MNQLAEDCFHLGVKILLCDDLGRVLLLEKKRRSGETFWELPGGRLQKGEKEMEALKREIEEETGLRDLGQVEPFDMFLTNIRIPTSEGDVGLILSIYHSEIGPSFTPKLSHEHINFNWAPLSEATEMLNNKDYPSSFLEKIVLCQ